VCSVCVTVCPNRANNYYLTEAEEVPVWKVVFSNGNPSFTIESHLKIEQKYQVLNIADFCNECGNCTTFCPTKGSPFRDKPRICLTEKSFSTTQNGFMFQNEGNNCSLLHNTGTGIISLTKTPDFYLFTGIDVKANFDLKDFNLIHAEILNNNNPELLLAKASEMKILIDNFPHF
jgi:putative selenate reductase